MTLHDIPVLIGAFVLTLVILDTYIIMIRYFDKPRVNDNEKDV